MTQNQIEDPPGVVLGGRYRLGPLIGRGGMASVHQARDEALDRTVAVKLFRTDITDPDELSRQEVEAKLLARLNHPNLVTVFDAGTETVTAGPQTYLVMGLVQGTDLRRALHSGVLPAKEVARVGAGVASALEYIHRGGVIHRDVKPANILMNNADVDDGNPRLGTNPKLTDFGIARLVDGARLTATGESLGTAMYFSPEQASGGPIGPACDVYSLGLVLLECLTGTTAFPGPAVASAAARLHRDADIPETLGAEWRELLRAMTQRDPADRPSTREVATALRALHQGVNTGATRHDTADVDTAAMNMTAALPNMTAALPNRTAALPTAPQVRAGLDVRTEPQEIAEPRATTGPAGTANSHEAAEPAAESATVPRRRSRRKKLLLSAAALVLVLAAAVVVLLLTLGSGTELAPVQYPSVPGQLGEHLSQLQESVEP